MEVDGISPASVSQSKLLDAQENAQVKVLKKQLDQEGAAQQILLDSVAEAPAPARPGVGGKLNTVA